MPFGGGSYAVVADGPNLTRAGETLRNLGWNEPNLAMDMFQVSEIRGNTEYLRLRSGQRVVGREWESGNWVYKARGRTFYMRRVQLVVGIPCSIRGVGNRDFYVERTMLPVSSSTLPGLSEQYVNDPAGVKQFVKDNIGTRLDNDGNLIVWEGSEVIYTLLDEEWSISELNYDPATGRSVVSLNRPLRGVPMLWGHLVCPELMMEESLQDTNGRCVFVALAKFMELPEGVVEGALHEIFDELHTPEERQAEPWCGN